MLINDWKPPVLERFTKRKERGCRSRARSIKYRAVCREKVRSLQKMREYFKKNGNIQSIRKFEHNLGEVTSGELFLSFQVTCDGAPQVFEVFCAEESGGTCKDTLVFCKSTCERVKID